MSMKLKGQYKVVVLNEVFYYQKKKVVSFLEIFSVTAC